jgi:ABC-2 type transport system permease protein
MRYLSLFLLQVRKSMTLGMQYRADFILSALLSLCWTAMAFVPFHIAFHDRPPVSGWTYEGALVVIGWFTVLKGVLDGAVNPSLLSVVEQIRTGTLDFVLLKPADAQFLVSTTKFEVWKILDVGAGVAIISWAFVLLGRAPSATGAAVSLVLFAGAVLVLYSIWILVIAAAFWVVRVDNLAYLFGSIFDFARWPVTVFRGVWRIIFTFVIPLGVMTTYPAQALLGALPLRTAMLSIGGSIGFALAARWVWSRSTRHYTSASS